jgi:lipid-A-disaccharide synthase-like uncharacterized protein
MMSRFDLIAVVAIVVAGFLTKSVAFVLSISVAALFALTMFVRWSPSRHSNVKAVYSATVYLTLLGGTFVLILFGGNIVDALTYLYQGGSGKGIVRLGYWIEALVEVMRSPIVGFGPGPHVPSEHSAVFQEAHNIFIDLFLSGGIISLTAFSLLLAAMLLGCLRYEVPFILFAVTALVILATFHTVLRHAHYWIALHASLTGLFFAAQGRGIAAAKQVQPIDGPPGVSRAEFDR